MTDVKDAAVVLFSGGQDSTTCLFWAKKQFETVYALSFVYGQNMCTRWNWQEVLPKGQGWSFM